ncbi:MAG: hypothetical protein H7A33_05970 [Deltaproteobacteria bacterium]|nr:hypothetical protein [Deltaproteobacteria bacterium]
MNVFLLGAASVTGLATSYLIFLFCQNKLDATEEGRAALNQKKAHGAQQRASY